MSVRLLRLLLIFLLLLLLLLGGLFRVAVYVFEPGAYRAKELSTKHHQTTTRSTFKRVIELTPS